MLAVLLGVPWHQRNIYANIYLFAMVAISWEESICAGLTGTSHRPNLCVTERPTVSAPNSLPLPLIYSATSSALPDNS